MRATLRHSTVTQRYTNGSVLQRLWISCAALILVGAALIEPRGLAGADGRDFAGSYQLTDTVDQGDSVFATFTTRVFDYSDADVSDATVVLDSRVVPGQTYWSFPSISIPNRASIRLQCTIKMPRAEYNMWQRGARPNLHIDTANPDGTFLRRTVELIRDLVREER